MIATETSLPAQVLDVAARQPDAVAIVDHGRRTTYGELAVALGHAGRALIAAGIDHGDRVAIWAPNSTPWVIAALGAQAAGAAIVPINTRYKTLEAAYPLERTDASVLIAANGFMGIDADAAVAAATRATDRSVRVVDLEAGDDDRRSWASFLDAGAATAPADLESAMSRLGHDDLCDIMFTSGSTGRPKGVRHRHGPTLRQTFDTIAENGIVAGDRLLVVNPFFHVFGYTGGWVPGLLAGATVYPEPVFDVDRVLQMIENEGITYFPGPPTIFHSILEHPRLGEFDVSSLRFSLTGSADVPVDLIQRMLDDLTFDRVVQAYGMTECGTATNTLAGDSAEVVATTIGVASKGLEVRVVDPDNQPVAPREPGEIVVRGYAVMDGYFDDPEATAATIDDEGWLHTGDRGSCDEDGYFRILGRIKDMIIVGGFNVYPAEVEDMLREHPAVRDAALVGVPDDRLGEVGCAFLATGAPVDHDEFTAWCRERMANFKVPRHVRVLDELPLTGSNKVSKVDLRDLAEQEGIGDRDVT